MAIALYARKSVERENSISCETQLEYCRAYIKPDERDEEVLEFVDNGYSGGNMDRDAFQAMMSMVKRGVVSKIIIYKLDRLSRSLPDFVKILQTLKDHNVKFVSTQESFDTSSPYGDLIVKILMIFAEFERTSTIIRVKQAYDHRSDMGFFMGGSPPYGYTLEDTVIHNIKTKKLVPVPEAVEHVRYIFDLYSRPGMTLRRVYKSLVSNGLTAVDGSNWSASKVSAMLRNPIYVRADALVYDYYANLGVRIVPGPEAFTGVYGAKLYNKPKITADESAWKDAKLIVMTHEGIINSEVWLKCQHRLASNKQLGRSVSNGTSWLAGKVMCAQCLRTMTIVRGKINKKGVLRRYFSCTGHSHLNICSGPKATIYADDIEDLIFSCIESRVAEFPSARKKSTGSSSEENAIRLQLKAIEKEEEKLVQMMLDGNINAALLDIVNNKAAECKENKKVLFERLAKIEAIVSDMEPIMKITDAWESADYDAKKKVVSVLIDKILIDDSGNAEVKWNM